MDIDYAGDLLPSEAWGKDLRKTLIVSCRLQNQCRMVFNRGSRLRFFRKKVIFVEWQTFPNMDKNPRFLQHIADTDITKNSQVILLCRSGARSRSAAEF